MDKNETEPRFFARPADFRRWLAAHHAKESALVVGYYKLGSGRPSLTWPESVDEALCFGWIDGVRRRLDEESYAIRFTPRKPDSTWSAINIRRMAELIAEGRVQPAGLAAFEKRSEKKSAIYSYEQREAAAFDAGFERRFRARKAAWTFFAAQPPGYRQLSTYWVMTAKREETREKRLEKLIEVSEAGKRI
ncbi:MAG: YdeI/OmpD-associated family protein [Acidobacteriota bacterium]